MFDLPHFHRIEGECSNLDKAISDILSSDEESNSPSKLVSNTLVSTSARENSSQTKVTMETEKWVKVYVCVCVCVVI